MEYLDLFPTVVAKVAIPIEVTTEMRTELQKQHKLRNVGNSISAVNLLLDAPVFKELKKALTLKVRQVFKEVYSPANHNINIYITQSWSNYTEQGEYHHKHMHTNSILSGVLYIDVDELDSISFFRDKDPLLLDIPGLIYTERNSSSWIFGNLKPGDLLIFPSGLAHEVPEKLGASTRISISFNSFITGEVGDTYDRTWLNLEKNAIQSASFVEGLDKKV